MAEKSVVNHEAAEIAGKTWNVFSTTYQEFAEKAALQG